MKPILDAIIFDFDGVLVDSHGIKTQAFVKLYEPFGSENAKKGLEYHRQNGGISRVKKIEYFYKEILKEPLSEAKLKELCDRFLVLALQGVIQCPFIPGAEEFLKQWHQKIKMFVISGTPEVELKEIIKQRDMNKYFVDIYGSPVDKITHTTSIIKNNGLNPAKMIFFGDAVTDYKAARACGVEFVGILRDPENPLLEFNDYLRIKDFNEYNLEQFVSRMKI